MHQVINICCQMLLMLYLPLLDICGLFVTMPFLPCHTFQCLVSAQTFHFFFLAKDYHLRLGVKKEKWYLKRFLFIQVYGCFLLVAKKVYCFRQCYPTRFSRELLGSLKQCKGFHKVLDNMSQELELIGSNGSMLAMRSKG